MRRSLAISMIAVGMISASGLISAIRPSDEREIDRLFAFCRKLGHKPECPNCFYRPEFWRESKRVADKSGPQIIHAVMRRAQRYPAADERSEAQWLALLAVVALLPRAPAIELLHHYEQSTTKAEQLWAHEYLIEFNMQDTSELVRQYSATGE